VRNVEPGAWPKPRVPDKPLLTHLTSEKGAVVVQVFERDLIKRS